MAQIYEEQMKWKKLSNEKVDKLRASMAASDESNASIHSNSSRIREKSSSSNTNNSSNHSTSSNINNTITKKSTIEKPTGQLEADVNMTPKVAAIAPKFKINEYSSSNNNTINNIPNDPATTQNRQKDTTHTLFNFHEIDASAEEPLVELLERERREWHKEREKLLDCIHMQQVVLNQQSIAAHERAAEIAKELLKTIERFDARLYAVENSSKIQADTNAVIIKSLGDISTKISQNAVNKSP